MTKGTTLKGLFGGVVLSALLAACGPTETPLQEATPGDPAGELTGMHSQPEPPGEPSPVARLGPAVAYGGGKFLVAWWDVRDGGVYATRMRPDGPQLSQAGIRLNIGTGEGGPPTIAYDGKQFVVVWDTGDGFSGVRVKPDGTVLGPVFDVITSGEVFGRAGLACSPEVCLVAFTADDDDGSSIIARRVTTKGEVLEELIFGFSRGARLAGEPTVAWNGKHFLVAWTDSRGGEDTPDIYGARVSPDGTLLDEGGFPISTAAGEQRTPDVVWTGRRFLVVWSDGRAGNRDIYGARVRSDTRVDDPTGLALDTSAGDQLFPAVAHHNSKSLVVSQSRFEDGTSRIRGLLVHENGTVLDPGRFAISSSDFDHETRPDVAYGGNRFLTAYAGSDEADELEPRYILGARVRHDTSLVDVGIISRSAEPLPAGTGGGVMRKRLP